VASDNFEILQWLLDHDCPFDEGACANAALYGRLDILMWWREKGCKWNESTMISAVMEKRMMMKWVREMKCPWNENTSIEAAKEGFLQELKCSRVQSSSGSEMGRRERSVLGRSIPCPCKFFSRDSKMGKGEWPVGSSRSEARKSRFCCIQENLHHKLKRF